MDPVKPSLVPDIDRPLPEMGLVVAAEQPCFVCTHPERRKIEAHYVKRGRHLTRTARKFGIMSDVLSRHLPAHLHSTQKKLQTIQAKDPEAALRLRLRERSATLWGYLAKAGTANEFDNVAKLAEVIRRYDEMLLKVQEAPGFRQASAGPSKGGPKIDAPNAKFLFVSNGQAPPELTDDSPAPS